MIDFDRSCYGPYPFDLARFLVSLAIFQQPNVASGSLLVAPSVLDALREGYLLGCNQPHQPFLEMKALNRKFRPDRTLSIREYIESKKGWAGQLEENTIYYRTAGSQPPAHIQYLLDSYFKSRSDDTLKNNYVVERVAEAEGSLGLKRFLILLEPSDSSLDEILLDLKAVIPCDPVSPSLDGGLYMNPFEHNGQRMIEASQLYAPGSTLLEGYASDREGNEFYVRSIPPWKEKIKGSMGEVTSITLCSHIGHLR